jgi:hypothetical protein
MEFNFDKLDLPEPILSKPQPEPIKVKVTPRKLAPV